MYVISVLVRLIATFFILFPVLAYAQEDTPDELEETGYAEWDAAFQGSYRNLFTLRYTDEFIENSTSLPEKKRMAADLNRISLSPEISYGEDFTFHADIDFEAVFSNYNKTVPFDLYWRVPEYNDFIKPSIEPVYNRNIYLLAQVRNIYLKMTRDRFSGTAGRQQVRFGSSRLWNPLDLLNPFSPLHVEGNDEQKGIDALRVDWYPGESTELTCVFNPVRVDDDFTGTSFRSSNYAARFKTGFSEFDAALLAAYTGKRKNAGFDFQLVLFDGMLTGAAVWSAPEHGAGYLQCGSGYEYTFGNGLNFLVEYFYNSRGVNDDVELQQAVFLMSSEGVQAENYYILANRIVTYNSHYLSVLAGFDIHPLLRSEVFTIYDFQGRGLFLNFSLKLNALQNLDLTAGAICAFVDEQVKASDFASYDRKPMLYVSADFYF